MTSTNIPNEQTRKYSKSYADFIASSPTAYHAAANIAVKLQAAGFSQISPNRPWPTQAGSYYLHHEGAVIAWKTGGQPAPFRIVAAHTDSPALKLKPVPTRTTADGWNQLLVEVYGGALNATWLDRELVVAGKLVDSKGAEHLVSTPPLALIPSLAPHLDAGVNTKGLVLDPQQHLQPLWGIGNTGSTNRPAPSLLPYLAEQAGLTPSADLLAWELFLVPAQQPGFFGVNNEFLAAGRQDNLSSTYAALHALLNSETTTNFVPVVAFFDHEEVGSASSTGARGNMLSDVLRRTVTAQTASAASPSNTVDPTEVLAQLMSETSLLSADAGHGVHPNYPDKLDPQVRPMLGDGPMLKVDADQRYVSNAQGAALWRGLCQQAGVPTQTYVTHSSLRSGSTIGPALATDLGVTTADVGVPLLAMHSTREVSHVRDTYLLSQALSSYFSGLPVYK